MFHLAAVAVQTGPGTADQDGDGDDEEGQQDAGHRHGHLVHVGPQAGPGLGAALVELPEVVEPGGVNTGVRYQASPVHDGGVEALQKWHQAAHPGSQAQKQRDENLLGQRTRALGGRVVLRGRVTAGTEQVET